MGRNLLTGTIVAMHPPSGLFLLQVEGGAFCVFELLAGVDLQVGDVIRGELDSLGRQELLHLEHGHPFDAYGQSGPCSLQQWRRLIGR